MEASEASEGTWYHHGSLLPTVFTHRLLGDQGAGGVVPRFNGRKISAGTFNGHKLPLITV